MNFTHTQKKYLKENVRKKTVAEMATELGLSEKEILQYFKDRWPQDKYKRTFENYHPAHHKTSSSAESAGSFFLWAKKHWIGLLTLTILVIITYANTYNAVFLSDDLPGIVRNPEIGSFSAVLQKGMNFFPYLLNYITYEIGGLIPFVFRIRSIFFHLGSTYVLFYLLSSLISPLGALIVACIFAVHPILVESITWISAFSYPAYGFFFLCALAAYFHSKKDRRAIGWSYGFFIVSLLLSEKAVVFPVVLLAAEIAFYDIKKSWKQLLAYFVISVIYGISMISNVAHRVDSFKTDFYSAPEFINPFVLVPLAITHYLEIIFWPNDLTIYHSEIKLENVDYILRLLFFIGYLGGAVYAYFKDRIIFFWLCFFLICLSPTLLPLTITWIVAERYAYVATIGIIVVVVYLLMKLARNKTIEPFVYLFLILTISGFMIRSIARNIDWNSEDNLYIATGKSSPSNPVTHNNLGDVYGRHGDYQRSIAEFKKGIELNPGYADAYHNLGNIYRVTGKFDLAIQSYRKALEINPKIWQSYQNISSIYFDIKNYPEALKNMQMAIQISPYPQSQLYANVGIIYLQMNDVEHAKESFNAALLIEPGNQIALQGLNTISQQPQKK